jgi:hypothetical protein
MPNIPNDNYIYMYTPTFFIPRPSKNSQIGILGTQTNHLAILLRTYRKCDRTFGTSRWNHAAKTNIENGGRAENVRKEIVLFVRSRAFCSTSCFLLEVFFLFEVVSGKSYLKFDIVSRLLLRGTHIHEKGSTIGRLESCLNNTLLVHIGRYICTVKNSASFVTV